MGKGHKWRLGMQPLTHRRRKIEAQWPLDSSLQGAFEKPEGLTIITVSTLEEKSIFEQSLDFLGIKEYIVIKRPQPEPWKFSYKIEWILEYLQTKKGRLTKYLLFCDAYDVILRDDPQKVIDIFERSGYDMLFCSTMVKKGIFTEIPWLFEWSRMATERPGRYLNSGVFIGKSDFVFDVLKAAHGLVGDVFDRSSDDQEIFRFLYPWFYPRIGIDCFNALVYRN